MNFQKIINEYNKLDCKWQKQYLSVDVYEKLDSYSTVTSIEKQNNKQGHGLYFGVF